jgi:hypothetical protein
MSKFIINFVYIRFTTGKENFYRVILAETLKKLFIFYFFNYIFNFIELPFFLGTYTRLKYLVLFLNLRNY